MTVLATAEPTGRTPTRPTAPNTFRSDIQGLRAVAVALVILSHLVGWPSGGFVGVDMFFVISGFLITGLLLREQARTGRISFVDFYRRRVRRIIPVATTVLVVTVAVSYLVFFAERARSTLFDSIWSLVFAANWHFALIGTNYQQAAGPVSPLQHFWSLAVEEQFYVVWPWLLLLVLALANAKIRWSATRSSAALGSLVLVVIVASFTWGLWETANEPTWAYFSTFSRAWELGIGAALAVFSAQLQNFPAAARTTLAWAGLAGIAAAAFLVNSTSAFPAPWALLPVLSTAAVIAAGTGGTAAGLTPLTNAGMDYVGKISYSLYLWHWPIIVIVGTLLPNKGVTLIAIDLALMIGFSVISFHCVEDPIRRSHWLERRARPGRDTNRPALLARRAGIVSLLTLCVLTGAVSAHAVLRDHAPKVHAVALQPEATGAGQAIPPGATTADLDKAVGVEQSRRTASIDAALSTSQWPELAPSLDEIGPNDKASEWIRDGCLGGEASAKADPQKNALRCVYGDPRSKNTAVVLGDSHAISYVPGIRAALEPLGWKIEVYTLAQCPADTVTVLHGDGSAHPTCNPFREWALLQIARQSPKLVIMSSGRESPADTGVDGSVAAQWRTGTDTTLTRLSSTGAHTVVLSAAPGGKSIQQCATRAGSPADCVKKVSDGHDETAASNASSASAFAGKVVSVDTTAWFCSANASCPAFVGTTPVYADGTHMTDEYSKRLGPLLRAVLLRAAAK